MRRTFLLTVAHRILWLVAVTLSGSAFADSPVATFDRAAPSNVLFVGNSFIYYNNSLHNHYRALVRSSEHLLDTQAVTRSMTISGSHLSDHAGGLPSMLTSEQWDVVILQGNSLGPITEVTAGSFREAARDYSARIRGRGGRPVFFMTWAHSGKPEMTPKLDDAYSSIGLELGVEVVPVGLAFATVTRERPDISLRIGDARHPTMAGTYLAACTFFAALFNQSPEGLEYSAGLDRKDAIYLQDIAWQTVIDYRSRDAQIP